MSLCPLRPASAISLLSIDHQVSQREKLLDAAVEYLAVPTLTLTYEDLTSNHRAAIRKLSAFLQVPRHYFRHSLSSFGT